VQKLTAWTILLVNVQPNVITMQAWWALKMRMYLSAVALMASAAMNNSPEKSPDS